MKQKINKFLGKFLKISLIFLRGILPRNSNKLQGICNENSKKNMKKYRSRINSDTNIYLVYDENGTLLFTFTRKEIINKLGIKNKQFDFALASGTEINGFYFDVEII